MSSPLPPKRSGRKKVPPGRRFSERVVFRLTPSQHERLAERAREHGMTPNDYARGRALGRARPTQAQRRLATEGTGPLDEIEEFVAFAQALLPHLETRFGEETDLGKVVRRARHQYLDPGARVARLRVLVEEAVHP